MRYSPQNLRNLARFMFFCLGNLPNPQASWYHCPPHELNPQPLQQHCGHSQYWNPQPPEHYGLPQHFNPLPHQHYYGDRGHPHQWNLQHPQHGSTVPLQQQNPQLTQYYGGCPQQNFLSFQHYVGSGLPQQKTHLNQTMTRTLIQNDHYGLLMEQLGSCHAKWETIATGLRFHSHEIDTIKVHPMFIAGGPEACLREVLNQWLHWVEGDARGSKDVATLEALKTAVYNAGFPKVANSLTIT